MKATIVGLFLLFSVGCSQVNPDKTADQVVKEVAALADTLQKGLDTADEKLRPFLDSIDLVCKDDSSDFCKKAVDASERFGAALDKAQTAVDKYRQFAGEFGPAADAVAEVVKAAADVVKASAGK